MKCLTLGTPRYLTHRLDLPLSHVCGDRASCLSMIPLRLRAPHYTALRQPQPTRLSAGLAFAIKLVLTHSADLLSSRRMTSRLAPLISRWLPKWTGGPCEGSE